jgi:UDP-N-acetylmuramoyl-L-alanyl-D-glutamate--2,6-diaminopimelate ligase
MKKIIPQKLRNVYHLGQAILANLLYGFPSRKITIIGVTGTNGKTTTCQMIAKVLEEAGNKIALSTTINFKLGDKEWVNKTKFTTLSPFTVQKFISEAVKAGCKYLILETSSHSLDQYRIWGIDYDTAVITNVTREHLDYHKTMEVYRKAKLKLFKLAKTVIVNLDMEKPEDFLRSNNEIKYAFTCHPEFACPASFNDNFRINFAARIVSVLFENYDRYDRAELAGDSGSKKLLDYGSGAGMTLIKAENIELGINFTEFKIENLGFKIFLPGLFNVENSLSAVCVGLNYGVNLETSARALKKIKSIPGRMEYVENNKGLNIIIDYAVTPDSLEKLYFLIDAMRKSKNHPEQSEGSHVEYTGLLLPPRRDRNDSKIIAVFGSCGERDRGKRPIMGGIVDRYADYIIVTNEDPYNEDSWQIINEVAAGIKDKQENVNFWKILDRREAIKKALALAGPGDYILVTGKGAEETMVVGEKRISWNDKNVIQEELLKLS